MTPPPWCALCAEDRTDLTQQPLGRNDAPSGFCADCVNVHPRTGRYAFSDAASSARRSPMATGFGGDGHRRRIPRAQ